MRILLSPFVIAAVVYLGLCVWMFATQRSQIYFPTPESTPHGAQALWLHSESERIKVGWCSVKGRKALVYFAGNAEDVAGDIEVFSAAFPEHSLYLVNYRGYGGSSGKPSEAGLKADALTVFDYVQARHREVAVMGRSLGSGVAVYLASERPVARLVLVTAYDSLVNVAKDHIRWLPVGLLLRDRYDTVALAPKVTVPVLVVIAGEDEIIFRSRSDALVGAFRSGQVEIEVVNGVGHNTLDLSPAYLESVQRFLSEAARAG